MDVFRAIYTSRPFGFDQAMLSGILIDARHANIRDGITGALICRADIYLQWLEGPEAQVRVLSDKCEPVSVCPTDAGIRRQEGRATRRERRRGTV